MERESILGGRRRGVLGRRRESYPGVYGPVF